MKLSPAAHRGRPTALALAATTSLVLLGGCSAVGSLFSGEKVDYKTTAARTRPLEVPPDLTQLARDTRFNAPGGVVSASGTAAAQAAPAAGTAPVAAVQTVAPQSRGAVRVERAGNERWLVVPMPPEQLWPQLKAFWAERGFTLAIDSPEAGVMETAWAENRSKLPQDFIRNTLGRLAPNLYDTGERDLFRTRVERTTGGSEVYISHRGLEEVYVGERKESTAWRARASDPQLEAEFLSRLMVTLGTPEPAARTAVAAVPDGPARARVTSGAALEVDEPFDRAWRRVGVALDRSGFSVEDRDRAAGTYFVRYVDPKTARAEEPGFLSRLFGASAAPAAPQRYRVVLKAAGDTRTAVSVQTASGGADSGETGARIAAQLAGELR